MRKMKTSVLLVLRALKKRFAQTLLCSAFLGVSSFALASTTPTYFGYYASARSGVGTAGTGVDGDYAPEIYNQSNVSWVGNYISDPTSSAQEIVSKIREASSFQMGAIVDLNTVFFETTATGTSLSPNYLNNWSTFLNVLTSNGSDYSVLENIVAFYPIDEPNCQSGVTDAVIGTVVSTIKNSMSEVAPFLSIPVAAIYCYSSPDGGTAPLQFVGEEYFDWVGLDCYPVGLNPANPATNFQCPGFPGGPTADFSEVYSMLTSGLSANQRTILVPQASEPPQCASDATYGCSANAIAPLEVEANDYQSFATTHPEVVGIFPFIYQSFGGWVGLEELPALQSTWLNIAQPIARPNPNSGAQSATQNLLLSF
jgi:hypothetical protein